MVTTAKAKPPKENPPKSGPDKYGFTGKRKFAAAMYGRPQGATTAQVVAAGDKKYGKGNGYPMLNLLTAIDKKSKLWRKATSSTTSPTTGRTVLCYYIKARK